MKETEEFVQSLKPGDEIVKPIYNPEAFVLRDQLRSAANRGSLPRTACRHPLANIVQMQDQDPSVKRRGNDVNLFICGVCDMHLWLTDPWGTPISDS